ncbi:tagaturonate reductase [Paenibacillus sp. SORGH_AS306]|uniref:tagaturonate reductase n=1 Tax=unclassified Paenibacillus TaxID=185978 RepID=UPI002788E764|nr:MULTISPECIES: tagaturonate reductase [unclassified Paenibacillus]MDQ1235846.1 tagaturonate reductase [Paenibacillus sp. SORGH_AS_0306]MDR6112896.1 tagaturonate reductase [Paenibacillus sp. SORGH_AS_0338]
MNTLNRTTYHATTYTEKVVQFGEGNFLRAFTDWQIHQMNKKANFDAGVVIVQPLATGMAEQLNEQDGLYTVYLEGIQDGQPSQTHEVIECVTRGINPYEHYETYEALAYQPELRWIISNTTEAGIAFHPTDQLADRPQQSYPGKLTSLLYRRFRHFHGEASKGFIILPCELIDHNGDELKKIVLQYADLWNLEPEFVAWVHQANTFCSSLVDRIVPGYPKQRMPEITAELGYEDSFVVVGEPFHLLVIEGPSWIEQELPFAQAGLYIKVVEDMAPYRTRKVRILNGAHTAMTPVAYLYGLNTVAETVDHPVTGAFVRSLIQDEIIPTLDLPAEELEQFAEAVMERFRNPYVQHFLMSISLNSISKFKTRDLPTLTAYIEQTVKLPQKLVFSLAALIAFYKGERSGEPIALNDDIAVLQQLAELWKVCDNSQQSLHQLVTAVLGELSFWGMDLNHYSGLTEQVTNDLYHIQQQGIVVALQALMDHSATPTS